MPVIGVQKNCAARAIITSVSGRVAGAETFSPLIPGVKFCRGQQFFAVRTTAGTWRAGRISGREFQLAATAGNWFFPAIKPSVPVDARRECCGEFCRRTDRVAETIAGYSHQSYSQQLQ